MFSLFSALPAGERSPHNCVKTAGLGRKKGEFWIFLAGEAAEVCAVPPREGALPSKIHDFRGDKTEQE